MYLVHKEVLSKDKSFDWNGRGYAYGFSYSERSRIPKGGVRVYYMRSGPWHISRVALLFERPAHADTGALRVVARRVARRRPSP